MEGVLVAMKLGGNRENLTGQTFGMITALSPASGRHWVCRCDCGEIRKVQTGNLKSGKTKSCGNHGQGAVSHGRSYSPIYRSWASMKQRCINPLTPAYKNYGGRGISICERWLLFENFLTDMGERPRGYWLDRIDVDGNYELKNCRWATATEQARNRRTTVRLEFQGKTQSIADWADELGINYETLYQRIRVRKMSVEKAFRL